MPAHHPDTPAQAGFPTNGLTAARIAQRRETQLARKTILEVSRLAFRTLNPPTPAQIPTRRRKTRVVSLAPSRPDVMFTMFDHFGPGAGAVIAEGGWQLAETRTEDSAPLLARLDAFLQSEVNCPRSCPTHISRIRKLSLPDIATGLWP